MSSKTPSSLKWLADKRARLSGKLSAYESELADLEKRDRWLREELAEIRDKISAVDSTIKLHEVQIEPSDIREIRPSRKALFPHGVLTRSILAFMRSHPGQWFLTGELVNAVCAAATIRTGDYDAQFMRRLVRNRLRAMAARQILERHEGRIGAAEQRWRLRCS